jgi:NAD(P)-dependent dehydrogenase (short-subunit alcohol dehydrogenase family)
VTGASSGIGKEAAILLASMGWKVIVHGRDAGRLEGAISDMAAAAPDASVQGVQADLCLLSDADRMVREIEGLADRIDLLIANAGGVRAAREVTPEGNEVTFAGNHLGHFLVTTRLLPLLQAAARNLPPGNVRIINVSSRGHAGCQKIDWNDLQGLGNWSSVGAYAVAKLANVLFAKSLAQRLAGDGIVAHALHPGVVASNFASHGTPELQAHMANADCVTPREAAEALVWLATDPEPGKVTGLYWSDSRIADPSPLAQDMAAAERLWRESEALLAMAGY